MHFVLKENILEDQGRSAKQSQPKPRKLKTNFDDILREKEETERQEAEKLRKQQFEEERKLMRAAKMVYAISQLHSSIFVFGQF